MAKSDKWDSGIKVAKSTKTWMYKKSIKKEVFEKKRAEFGSGGKFQTIVEDKKRAAIHGPLRKRKVGAKRGALDKISPINAKYYKDKVINNSKAKAHLFPDTFGGKNETNNLSFVSEKTNLSVHKSIENDISREMKMNFSGLQGKKPVKGEDMKTRGSLIVDESFGKDGKSTGREYFVHINKGDQGKEKYLQYHFKKID